MRDFSIRGHREHVGQRYLRIDVREDTLDRDGGRSDVSPAADCPADAASWRLSVRHIVRASASVLAFLETTEFDGTDDSHDLQPRRRRSRTVDVLRCAWNVHASTDGGLIWPESRRKLFVDDDDARSCVGVRLRKEPPALERDFQRFEVSR